jgi:RHS repeat-associated protein
METNTVELINTHAANPGVLRLVEKQYELSNHLGNVLSVINDIKLPVNSSGTVISYISVVVSAHDYSPFGVVLKGRNWITEEYRYGFNGKEKDDEYNSSNDLYNFDARIFDSRLGRWLTRDPRYEDYPSSTPYSGMNNNPIWFADPSGEGGIITNIRYVEISPGVQQLTGDMEFNVFLYSDEVAVSDIENFLGCQVPVSCPVDGIYTFIPNVDDGAAIVNVLNEKGDRVPIKLNVRVNIQVISASEASEQIQSETSKGNNYIYVNSTDENGLLVPNGANQGFNLNGSNQGSITSETLNNASSGAAALMHEIWHSVGKYIRNSPVVVDGMKRTWWYGGHPMNDITFDGFAHGRGPTYMDPAPRNWFSLSQHDFQSLRMWNTEQGQLTFVSPAFYLRKLIVDGIWQYEDVEIGGDVDNTDYIGKGERNVLLGND